MKGILNYYKGKWGKQMKIEIDEKKLTKELNDLKDESHRIERDYSDRGNVLDNLKSNVREDYSKLDCYSKEIDRKIRTILDKEREYEYRIGASKKELKYLEEERKEIEAKKKKFKKENPPIEKEIKKIYNEMDKMSERLEEIYKKIDVKEHLLEIMEDLMV